MANTLLLRRRIKTAQNVSKTTRAMQMIAASKFKRAQDATLASRPYVDKLSELGNLIATVITDDASHPFLQSKDNIKKHLLIVISPDKGLCGGLITNLLRDLLAYDKAKDYVYLTLGKKLERHIVRLGKEVVAAFPLGTTLPSFGIVAPIAQIIEENYVSEKVASVSILSTHFDSIFLQKPSTQTILPISLTTLKNPAFTSFEPNIDDILPDLLSHYLEMAIYQQILESFVSEQASRMVAMQNATENAKEIISELTLSYNKARQAKITNEILDITGAFASM